MTFNAKKLPSGSNTKRPPALEEGSYPARLVQLINMGIQPSRPFKGEEKPPRLTVRVTYELLDEFLKDEDGLDMEDKPRWLSEEFAFMSLKQDKATSTKRYYALDPEDKADGDWSQLLAAPCMVTVVAEADKRPGMDIIYNKVGSISAMRPKEAAKAPGLVNPTLLWDFYSPDIEVFKNFPEWLQTKIQSAVDYDGSKLQQLLGGASEPPQVKEKKAEPKEEEESEDW